MSKTIEEKCPRVAEAIGGSMSELKALREEGWRKRHAERNHEAPAYAKQLGVVSGKRFHGAGKAQYGHMKGVRVKDPVSEMLRRVNGRNWSDMPDDAKAMPSVSCGYRAVHAEWERSRNPYKRTPFPATPNRCKDSRSVSHHSERTAGVWHP